jgi:2-iminobutanoate/2-iminopropanoate deaminase
MQILNPEGMYHSEKYYSGVRVGNMIFTAGRVPVDEEGNVFAPNDPAAQTARIMEDLERILNAGGATLQDVVSVHTYYLYPEDGPVIHEVRQRYFGDHYPPHTGIRTEGPSWVERGVRLEIEVVAALEE